MRARGIIVSISLSGKLSREERPQMNLAELRWTSVNFSPLAMCSDCLFANPQRSSLAVSRSLLKILIIDSFTLAAEGTAPFLIFFFAHSSPPSCVSKGCNYSLGKWCCLSASSREFDLSWLPALTCLGRARKGNGWELPSNHELVPPPSFSFLFPISFPPPSQPEEKSCCIS